MNQDYLMRSARVDELRARLADSEAMMLHHGFLSANTSWNTFIHNFHDLFRLIQLHEQLRTQRKLGDFFDRAPLNEFLVRTITSLQNFVFSANSLAEHTNRFMTTALREDCDAYAEYRQRVKDEFLVPGIGPFTKEVRNFFAHVSSPFISSMQAGSDGNSVKEFWLVLQTADMRRSPGVRRWSAPAVQFAETHGPDVNLETYALAYYGKAVRFYEWLDCRNSLWFKDAWERGVALEDELEGLGGFRSNSPRIPISHRRSGSS